MDLKGLPTLESAQTAHESTFWGTDDLRRAGVNDREVRKLVRAGTLSRLRRGYYVSAQLWENLAPKDRELQQIVAHADSQGGRPAGIYSHGTAARLHGLLLWKVDALIHVTQAFKSSTTKGSADVCRHFRRLAPEETTTVRALPATTLERTVVDCAASLDYDQGLILADHAARLGADQEKMNRMASSMCGARGIRTVRRVLADLNPLSESPGETLTRILMKDAGIPMPQLQLKVTTRSGEHRLDFGWEDLKVALEFDGDSKYFDYEPTPQVLRAERKRENALMEQGWSFIRLEWKDLFRPVDVERRIRDALRKAARAAEAAPKP